MKVKFKNVGHSNACWEAECEELTEHWLFKQVKPYCMSRYLEFGYNEETGQGIILAGVRVIGNFHVKK